MLLKEIVRFLTLLVESVKSCYPSLNMMYRYMSELAKALSVKMMAGYCHTFT